MVGWGQINTRAKLNSVASGLFSQTLKTMVNRTAGRLVLQRSGKLSASACTLPGSTTARSLRISLALHSSPSSPEKEKTQAAKPLTNYGKCSQVTFRGGDNDGRMMLSQNKRVILKFTKKIKGIVCFKSVQSFNG